MQSVEYDKTSPCMLYSPRGQNCLNILHRRQSLSHARPSLATARTFPCQRCNAIYNRVAAVFLLVSVRPNLLSNISVAINVVFGNSYPAGCRPNPVYILQSLQTKLTNSTIPSTPFHRPTITCTGPAGTSSLDGHLATLTLFFCI